MTLMTKFLGAVAATALTAGAALAEPALIFDLGGKFDKSFNEAAFMGAQRWAEETGETFREIAQDTTILLVEQNFNFARALGRDMAVIDDGRVVHQSSMADFAADTDAQKEFLRV